MNHCPLLQAQELPVVAVVGGGGGWWGRGVSLFLWKMCLVVLPPFLLPPPLPLP